jgi:PAS domain S-box-containing protein
MLKKSEEKYKRLFNSSPDLIIETDEKGNIMALNQMMTKSLGAPAEKLIDKNIFDILPREIAEERAKIARTALKEMKNQETYDERAGRCFHNIYVPILYPDGNKTIQTIVRDITEQKKTEDALRESKEKYRTLLETTDTGFCILDLQGNILDANSEYVRLSGHSSIKEIQGRNVIEWTAKYDLHRNAEEVKKCKQQGFVRNLEIDYVNKNGGVTPIEINATTIQTSKDKRILTLCRDITERKQVEKSLKHSEENYRILFNDVPVGISITDKSGHIMNCNQHMAEMFGTTYEVFKTNNIKSFYVDPEDRERLLKLLYKEGKVVDWECSFKRKDGAVFFAILNVNIIDRKGQKLNLTSLRDITERKVVEEKIKKQNVQLKKLDRVKNDFLNSTSHELRTPVASIKGYIQMLLKHTLGDITEEQKKALEVLLRNTNRLDHLIQDILDVSRLESGTMKFITEKTDVTKMVNEIAETMQTSADLKRIKINIDIQKEIPDLMIDSERVKQVLINLVDNAIKFSPDSSTINIKARKEKENVLFEVQDFGRGIPKNKQKKIFERFYQVDSGIDRKFGGIGLGLTISKKIIDTYDGQIWVDSTLGKGSSFKFSLPLQSTKNIEGNLQEIMEWS